MNAIQTLLNALTLEEKAALVEGYQSWMTNAVPRLDIPSAYLTDGPVGVRKKSQDKGAGAVGLGLALPSTAFPASVNIANSWDPANAEKMGRAIGEECIRYDVDVLLAPAMNLKRDPRCGRNFEYYSEDPLLTGKMAAAFTRGVQSTGTAACPKHFAANNCEQHRYMSDSVVDERAARELYLKGFELCVKESAPRTMMCAYNKLNGEHCSQNTWLLDQVLRREWGYDGLVMTDWGATLDRAAGVAAGLDLDMPGGIWENRLAVIEGIKNGTLSMESLDQAVSNVLRLVKYAKDNGKAEIPADETLWAKHHELAVELACDSAVLLKNDAVLPLTGGEKILAVGELFSVPRYQGAGSSGINPARLVSAKDAFDASGIAHTYVQGYREVSDQRDLQLEQSALEAAKDADVILFFGGLTDLFESEGLDRKDLSLPNAQLALLEQLCGCGKKLIAVLFGGSPFEVPFAEDVDAILHMFLGGQGVGEACRRLLYGEVNPSGKLSETWMKRCEDIPYGQHFGKDKVIPYYESIYVGYRYYDLYPEKICYPFGYGLSYTTFSYSDLTVESDGTNICAELTLTNSGSRPGAEVVQLYVGKNSDSAVFKAEKTLQVFAKVHLDSGESRRIRLQFPCSQLAYYHTERQNWVLENGTYPLLIGSSSRDIHLESSVTITDQPVVNDVPYDPLVMQAYDRFSPQVVTKEVYEALLGRSIPAEPAKTPFTGESPLWDYPSASMGKFIYRTMLFAMRMMGRGAKKLPEGPEKAAAIKSQHFMLQFLPGCCARSVVQSGGGIVQMNVGRALPLLANGKIGKALLELCKVRKAPVLPCYKKK